MKTLIWNLIKYAYRTIGRPKMVELIDNPDTDWDDKVIQMLDALFDYSK